MKWYQNWTKYDDHLVSLMPFDDLTLVLKIQELSKHLKNKIKFCFKKKSFCMSPVIFNSGAVSIIDFVRRSQTLSILTSTSVMNLVQMGLLDIKCFCHIIKFQSFGLARHLYIQRLFSHIVALTWLKRSHNRKIAKIIFVPFQCFLSSTIYVYIVFRSQMYFSLLSSLPSNSV